MNKKKVSTWRLKPFPMFVIGMALAALYVGQTLNFLFESDDFRFLWWAYQNINSPWAAFYDAPLFGEYYRPIVSLVWWIHYRFFGTVDYYHQLMTGLWWMASVGLLFHLVRVRVSSAAGLAAMLALLCMYAGVNPIVWKSWLTTICSVTFQLAALLALHSSIQRTSVIRLSVWLFLCACAFLSKESAIICLPLTTTVMIVVTSASWKKKIGLLSVVVVITTITLMYVPSLNSLSQIGYSKTNHLGQSYIFASYYAGLVWTSAFLQGIGFLLILSTSATKTNWRIIGSLFIGAASVGVWLWAISSGISSHEAVSLSLMILINILWLSPSWRRFSVPLVWLTFSFWPLAVLQERCVPYACNASFSMAWLLGAMAQPIILRALATVKEKSLLRQVIARMVAMIIIVATVMAMNKNLNLIHNWVHYAETVFHGPERQVRQAALYDLAARAVEGSIYIQVGDRLGLETYLAFTLPEQFKIPLFIEAPPENAYRLEAYSESVYSIYPKSRAFDIWIDSSQPPARRVHDDPYFTPERWDVELISNCNSSQDWSRPEQVRVVSFPIGTGAHLQQTFSDTDWIFHLTKSVALVPQAEKWVLQFWLETRRWDCIESVNTSININGVVYQWENSPLERWGLSSDWRRVSLSSNSAVAVDSVEDVSFSMKIDLTPRQSEKPPLFIIGVDEINLFWNKTN